MPTAPIGDIVTYYEEAGAGDPLLMIMGLGGDLQAWALNVPELAKHFRVVTYDNRGAGRTSATDKPYTIAGMANDAAGLLDHLGIAKAHVIGFSMGGYIAQELALRHPGKVDRLVLLATGPYIDGYGRVLLKSLMDIRRSSLSEEANAHLMSTYLYSAAFFEDTARYEQAIRRQLANPYAQLDHAFLRQAQAILDWSPGEQAKNIKQDTLIAYGPEDTLVPPRNAKRLDELVPSSTLKELPGAHAGVMEFAPEYNAAFVEFLKG